MRVHTKPKKVEVIKTLELIASMQDIPTLALRYKELIAAEWQIFVVYQRRGQCYPTKKWITIPLWALEKPKGYWIYYVAHEFAHSNTHHYREVHGPEFMAEMKRLCPEEYHHHELGYKQDQATQAGITREHAHKAQNIKVLDIWDLL
jgi:predicted metal-dependent hydrolase